MSRTRVVYHLESQKTEGAAWGPVLGEGREPITVTGHGAKSQALALAAILLRYPSFWSLRVRCGDEIVKMWVRKEGTSS